MLPAGAYAKLRELTRIKQCLSGMVSETPMSTHDNYGGLRFLSSDSLLTPMKHGRGINTASEDRG